MKYLTPEPSARLEECSLPSREERQEEGKDPLWVKATLGVNTKSHKLPPQN